MLLGGDVDRDISLVRRRALTGGGAIAVVRVAALLPVLIETPLFGCSVRGFVSLSPVLAPLVALAFLALVLRRLASRFTISIRLSLTRPVRLALLTTLLSCAGVPVDRPVGIATKQLKEMTNAI